MSELPRRVLAGVSTDAAEQSVGFSGGDLLGNGQGKEHVATIAAMFDHDSLHPVRVWDSRPVCATSLSMRW